MKILIMNSKHQSFIISISFLLPFSPLTRSLAFPYTVGNSLWSIPPSLHFYSNWSSSINFTIGDSLIFEFDSGFYNVIQVSNQEYDSCTANNPFKVLNSSPAIVVLNEQGVFYYICNVSNYCDLGQKVPITVDSQVSATPSQAPLWVSSPSFAPIEQPEPSAGEGNRSQTPAQHPVEAPPPPVANKNSSDSSVSRIFVLFSVWMIMIQMLIYSGSLFPLNSDI